jgi:alkylation response protein AidB-like acyl-CoA dehydrogenase
MVNAASSIRPATPEPRSAIEAAQALAPGFAARAAVHDRDGSFPHENFKELAEAGLLALPVPAPLGGGGASPGETARVINIVGQADPSTALVLAMHYVQHLVMATSDRYPVHLARKLQRESVEGLALINALRVEPELGSPSRGGLPATIARRTDTGWRLTGHKLYSTGAPALKWYVVWVRTDEPEVRVGPLLVPAGRPGIRIVETWDHLGLRASGSHDVVFEDVLVPLDHEVDLRKPADWQAVDPFHLAIHGLFIAAIYDGVARAAQDWLRHFVTHRVPSNLGAPLATLPRVQEAVGENEIKLAINKRLIASFSADIDAGVALDPGEAATLKLAVTNNAVAVVEGALALAGNHGLSRTNSLERHYRDVLCARVHTPQDDSIRVAAGRLALEKQDK